MVHLEMIKTILASANLGNTCRETAPQASIGFRPPIVDREVEDLGSSTEGGFSDGCCGRDEVKKNTWLNPIGKCRQII